MGLRKGLRVLVVGCLVAFFVAGGTLWCVSRPVGGSPLPMHIQTGWSALRIGRTLQDARLIRDARAFYAWAQLLGSARTLQAGWYRIDPNRSTRAIVLQLARGETWKRRFAVPEGYTVLQIAQLWEEEGWGSAQQFLASVRRQAVQRKLFPVTDPRVLVPLEGYLFPDTYEFEHGISADMCVERMVEQFEKQWRKLAVSEQPNGLSRHETVTLASIVEKEARVSEERPLIAGVFLNRLRLGWKLQADPTVAYVLGNPARRLSRRDLEIDSPYNTYRVRGLPPGPICNPGYASLEAAYHPAATDAMYFVAKGDGTHHFSRTLAEHNRARKERQTPLASEP